MILTCPRCATRYSVDELHVWKTGRSVQCGNCQERWRAVGEGVKPELAIAAAATAQIAHHAPEAAEAPAPAATIRLPEPEPEAEPAATTESAAAQSHVDEKAEVSDPAPEPVRELEMAGAAPVGASSGIDWLTARTPVQPDPDEEHAQAAGFHTDPPVSEWSGHDTAPVIAPMALSPDAKALADPEVGAAEPVVDSGAEAGPEAGAEAESAPFAETASRRVKPKARPIRWLPIVLILALIGGGIVVVRLNIARILPGLNGGTTRLLPPRTPQVPAGVLPNGPNG